MASTSRSDVDIQDQRKSLNRLEEEIERELAELQSLNKSSEQTNKRLKTLISQSSLRDLPTPGPAASRRDKLSRSNSQCAHEDIVVGDKEPDTHKEPADCQPLVDEQPHSYQESDHPQPFSNHDVSRPEQEKELCASATGPKVQKNHLMDLVKELEDQELFRGALPEVAPLQERHPSYQTKPKRNSNNRPQKSVDKVNRSRASQPARATKRQFSTQSKHSSNGSQLVTKPHYTAAEKSESPEAQQALDSTQHPQLIPNIRKESSASINQYISLYKAEYEENEGRSVSPVSAKFKSETYQTASSTQQGKRVSLSNVASVSSSKFHTGNADQHRQSRPGDKVLESNGSTFRPQINKKSAELASKMGGAFERLTGKSVERQQARKRAQNDMEREYTFKPTINKTSHVLDEKFKSDMFNGDQLHRWDQLYLMKGKYDIDKQMKKLQSEKEALEHEQCTFQPNTTTSTYYLQRNDNSCLADRTRVWEDQKQMKLLKERQEIADKELDGCTFKPALQRRKEPSGEYSSNQDAATSIRGADKHFERIEIAKRKKIEKENLLTKNSGQNWQYRRTVPKQPKLGKQESTLLVDESTGQVSVSPSRLPTRRGEETRGSKVFHSNEVRERVVKKEVRSVTPQGGRSVERRRQQQQSQANMYQGSHQPVLQEASSVGSEQNIERGQRYSSQRSSNLPLKKPAREQADDEAQFTDAIAQLHQELHKIRF